MHGVSPRPSEFGYLTDTKLSSARTDKPDPEKRTAGMALSEGGEAFRCRVEDGSHTTKRFEGTGALIMDADHTRELRKISPDGKVKRESGKDAPKFINKLDQHRGRVAMRNHDGSTRYIFERQDEYGNFDPKGEWQAFTRTGKPLGPTLPKSPGAMLEHELQTNPPGVVFHGYYMNQHGGEGNPLDLSNSSKRDDEDIGVDLSLPPPTYENHRSDDSVSEKTNPTHRYG